MVCLQSILLFFNFVGVVYGVNVLYLISDDLRPEIGAYNPGHTMFTPSLDKLASESMTFDRSYVQQALCNPSRASFMTGRRPDSTHGEIDFL